jgi:hypothetical protein
MGVLFSIDIVPDLPNDESCLGIGSSDGTLSLVSSFLRDESEILIAEAKKKLAENATIKTVIMGHTHQSLSLPKGVNYFNTGCRTKYFNITSELKNQSWRVLKPNAYERLPYKLNKDTHHFQTKDGCPFFLPFFLSEKSKQTRCNKKLRNDGKVLTSESPSPSIA